MARARSLSEFQKAFADEASCVAFLFKRRWPDGFICPGCSERRAAVPRLWSTNLDHGVHGDASLQAAADGMVSGLDPHGDAF